MKRAFIGIVFALAAGCGGSSSNNSGGGTKNLANFEGTVWNGQITTTVTCPGTSAQSSSAAYAVVFSPGTGADLQYTSQAGCIYKFNVSGNTAALSNAPVSCSTSVSGTTVTLTWTSYNVTTSDGHALSLTADGTGSAQGQTCPFSMTGSATR